MHLAKGCDVKIFEKELNSCGQFNELASSIERAGEYNKDTKGDAVNTE